MLGSVLDERRTIKKITGWVTLHNNRKFISEFKSYENVQKEENPNSFQLEASAEDIPTKNLNGTTFLGKTVDTTEDCSNRNVYYKTDTRQVYHTFYKNKKT